MLFEHPLARNFPLKKADNGNRTRLSSLGSWCSTNELYPHRIYYYVWFCTKSQEKNFKYNQYNQMV